MFKSNDWDFLWKVGCIHSQQFLRIKTWLNDIAQLVKNPPAMQGSWVRKIRWKRYRLPTPVFLDFLCGSAGKEPTFNAGDLGSISGFGRSPGEWKGYPLQYSGLENSMDSKVCCVFDQGAKSLQSCPTLSHPMDCSPPGSSACRIFQAKILEWVDSGVLCILSASMKWWHVNW